MDERYYFGYLNSPEWKAKRKAVKKRCGGICERCHLYLVDEVHHLTYERVHNESLEDLQGLCCGCHDFLHGINGIDPIEKSIRVTVSSKIIEFWDSQAEKSRRVNIAKLPPERFRWTQYRTGDKVIIRVGDVPVEVFRTGDKLIHRSLENSQLGQFDVPVEVFLDEQGKPVFDPSKWEKYRVASWIGNRWYSTRREPRVKRTESIKAEVAEQEKRKELEERRLKENPEDYTSFEHVPPKTSKQAKALFRKYPRVVDRGCECAMRNVRETKTMGLVLDLMLTTTDGWSFYKIDGADQKLAEGKIVLDSNRKLWVVRH